MCKPSALENATTTLQEREQMIDQQLLSQIMAFEATASQGLTANY